MIPNFFIHNVIYPICIKLTNKTSIEAHKELDLVIEVPSCLLTWIRLFILSACLVLHLQNGLLVEITTKNHVSVEASIWSFWKSRQKYIRKRANVILCVANEKPNTRLISQNIYLPITSKNIRDIRNQNWSQIYFCLYFCNMFVFFLFFFRSGGFGYVCIDYIFVGLIPLLIL